MIMKAFIYSLIVVGLWMLIVQTHRYYMHKKKHDYDMENAVDYCLAHTPSMIYWAVPMVFVFIASFTGCMISEALTGGVVVTGIKSCAGYSPDFLKQCLTFNGEWVYIIPAICALITYILMDKDRLGAVTRVCNSLYYVFTEKKFTDKGDLVKRVFAEVKKAEKDKNKPEV